MGHHDDGLAVLAIEDLQEIEDLFGVVAVEVAGGLVAHQDGRIGDDGPGDGHTLLLPAGQLTGLVLRAVIEADDGQRRLGVAAALLARELGQQQREFDVALGVQHRQQVVELENEADGCRPPAGQLPVGQLVEVVLRDHHLSRRSAIQTSDDVQEGRLTATRGTHQRHEVAFVYRHIDAHQHLDELTRLDEGLVHVLKLNDCQLRPPESATCATSTTDVPSVGQQDPKATVHSRGWIADDTLAGLEPVDDP